MRKREPDSVSSFTKDGCPVLAVSNLKRPIITHEELAALDFEPYEPDVSPPDALKTLDETLGQFWAAARSALGVVKMTKVELIAMTRKIGAKGSREEAERLLQFLVGGRELTEGLHKLIEAAEIRTAVALANIYPDGDDDPSDSETEEDEEHCSETASAAAAA
jgi:hypothetical protein